MANQVNTKFVAILAAGLLAAGAGVAAVMVYTGGRSAEAAISKGDDALASGETQKAIDFYGRAVNKEPGNAAYIKKWIGAMESHTPATLQAYRDMYLQQYMMALAAVSRASKSDPQPFERVLNERYKMGLVGQQSTAAWENYIVGVYDPMLTDYRGDEKGRDRLRRFRGLARLRMIAFNRDLSAEQVQAGLDDLKAALAVDPNDYDAALGIADFENVQSQRLKTSNPEKAAELAASARKRLEAVAATKSPQSLRAELVLATMDIDLEGARGDMAEWGRRYRLQAPGVKKAMDKLVSLPPKDVEIDMAITIATRVAQVIENGRDVSTKLLADLKAGRADDPRFLLEYARFLQGMQMMDESIKVAEEASASKNVPVSFEGLLRYDVRIEAKKLQAETLFGMWDRSRDQDERARYVERIGELRKSLLAELGEGAPQVLALDTRLALMANDLAGARTLATRYNDETRRTDPAMLLIEGRLLLETGSTGAARQTLQRTLEFNPNDVPALLSLAEVEIRDNRYSEALGYAMRAQVLFPNNPQINERIDRLRQFAGVKTQGKADPVLECLRIAGEQTMGVGADVLASEATLEKCLKDNPGDPRLVGALIQIKVGLGKTEEIEKIVDDAIAAKPDNEQLKRVKSALAEKDPSKAQATMIDDAAGMTPFEKALSKARLYRTYNKRAEADAALAEAERLDPLDLTVFELRFADAMAAGDQAKLAELVKAAETRNLDRVGGLIFRARWEIQQQRLDEATSTLRAVVEKDKLNLVAWRLLGLVRIDQQRFDEAVTALEKANEIKPGDVSIVVPYLRALTFMNDLPKALDVARKNENACAGNIEFVEIFLQLEASAPGGNIDRAIDARTRLNSQLKVSTPQGKTNRAHLASLLINQSKFEQAEKVVKELRDDDPKNAVAIELQAGLAGRRGNVTDAVKIYRDFIAGLPAAERTPLLYINASRMMRQLGESTEAIKFLGEGRASQNPKFMEIDRELGDLLFQLGQYSGSVEAYRRVISAAPDMDKNGLLRLRVLEALQIDKKFDEFDAELARFPAEMRTDTVVLLEAAKAVGANDTAKARELFDQAVRLGPKNWITYYKRAEFNWDDPKMEKDVEADLDQVVRLAPNQPLGLVRQATWNRQHGRDQLALDQLARAISIEPNNEELRLGRIMAMIEAGRFRDAAEAAEESVKHFKGATKWRVLAIQQWRRVGAWDRVVEHAAAMWTARKDAGTGAQYVTALLKSGKQQDIIAAGNALNDPVLRAETGPEYRMLRAQLKAKQGQAAAAAADVAGVLASIDQSNANESAGFMEALTDMYPKLPDRLAALDKLEGRQPFTGYMAFFAAAQRIGEPSKKDAAVATLEALARDSKEARLKASAYGQLGTLAYQAQDWQKAHDNFAKGIQADPEHVELNNNMGFILATKMNRGTDAIVYAEKASKAMPMSSGNADTLGVAYMAAGDLKKAAAELKRAQDLAVNDMQRGPVYVHLAKLRLKQGDKLDAIRLKNLAYDLASKDEELRQMIDADLKELNEALKTQ